MDNGHPFSLFIFALKDGMIRIKIDETSPILPRYEVPGTVQELLTQKLVEIIYSSFMSQKNLHSFSLLKMFLSYVKRLNFTSDMFLLLSC